MKQVLLFVLLGSVITIHAQSHKNAGIVGKEIQGNFTGTNKKETARTMIVMNGMNTSTGIDRTKAEYIVAFQGRNVPDIMIKGYESILVNEGDLNGDGMDELSVYSAPLHGCTYIMTTYTFSQGKWKEFIPSFLIPTACENLTDDEIQGKVFKEGKKVYFYETDLNSEDFIQGRKEVNVK